MKSQSDKKYYSFARFVGLYTLIIALTGCLATAEELDISSQYQAVSTANGITVNGITVNGITVNGITVNGLDSSDAIELIEEPSGLMLLRYLVKCALPYGEMLRIEHERFPAEGLPGLFGAAPTWMGASLPEHERQAMSACMLAHVNAYGVSVPVSARRHGISDTTSEERTRFNRFEGAFFGRLFEDDRVMLACGGAPAPDFSMPYPSHEKSDRLIRRCTDVVDPSSDTTLCDFTYVGLCSEVCDTEIGGSYQDCRGPDGTNYSETMSTWLLAGDDPDSAWPEYYDEIYGSSL